MTRLMGQALWMVEQGARKIDHCAPRALAHALRDIKSGKLEFSSNFDIETGELAKAESLIGPPPCPEPLTTYASWYKKCILKLTIPPLHSAHTGIDSDSSDETHQFEHIIDLYASGLPAKSNAGNSGLAFTILWIDIKRTHPDHPPSTVLEALIAELTRIRHAQDGQD